MEVLRPHLALFLLRHRQRVTCFALSIGVLTQACYGMRLHLRINAITGSKRKLWGRKGCMFRPSTQFKGKILVSEVPQGRPVALLVRVLAQACYGIRIQCRTSRISAWIDKLVGLCSCAFMGPIPN